MTMLILIKSGDYSSFMTLAMISSGAVATDIPVKIFAMDEAVYALKKDVYENNRAFTSKFEEFNTTLTKAVEDGKTPVWWKLMEDLKDLGEIEITVCGLVTDLLGLEKEDFMPLVDEVAGVAMFAAEAEEADIVLTI